MILSGSFEFLEKHLASIRPDAIKAEDIASKMASGSAKQRVRRYQAYAIYILAAIYNSPEAKALEIGTYYGYCTSIIAQSMHLAEITTCNILEWEVLAAKENLQNYSNVTFRLISSRDMLKTYSGPQLDFIFVDGDHKRIDADLPWYNWLREGGLILFHDYSPRGAAIQCPPVYRSLNKLQERLGRPFDIRIVDDQQVGMAGYYRRLEEKL